MTAVLLNGHGGLDQLEVRDDVPVPKPAPDEVLVRVAASAVNNTDINTRTGWYSRREGESEQTAWSGESMDFPWIQGADCAGRIEAVGSRVDSGRVGERVLVRTMQDPDASGRAITLGSEIPGAFAEYVAVRSTEACAVHTTMDDVHLGVLPCSYSTAEGLLQRAALGAERVLITGASGGVGSAAVLLARLRGAHITAIASGRKATRLLALGADVVVDRDADLTDVLGENSVDVVIDVVGGRGFPGLLRVLRSGGRCAVSGAVGGAHVDLDLRDLYLKDLTLAGSTFTERRVFTDLIRYIEEGLLEPVVAHTFPLAKIGAAQETFLRHEHVGKIALIPPPPESHD